VVGDRRLARVLEVGARVRAALAPAAPDERPLLADADHHDPEAPLPLGRLQVGTGDLLLRLAPAEADDRDLVGGRERVDLLDIALAVAAEQRRRGNPKAAVEQEADQPAGAHQLRDPGVQQDPVDRTHAKRDTLAE